MRDLVLTTILWLLPLFFFLGMALGLRLMGIMDRRTVKPRAYNPVPAPDNTATSCTYLEVD